MGSYVHEHSRVFHNLGDATELPTKKRSEARLKEYYSATDARAWCNDELENKKYFIELINLETPKSIQLGKYIPIEVLIDILMATKNASMEAMTNQMRALEEFVSGLKLTPEQKARLDKILAGDLSPDAEAATSGPKSKEDDAKDKAKDKTKDKTKDSAKEGAKDGAKDNAKDNAKDKTKDSAKDSAKDIGKGKKDKARENSKDNVQEKDGGLDKKRSCSEKDALAIKAIEQLENIKSIVSECDDLQKKLTHSQEEIETLKKCICQKNTCEADIKEMECQMERLRAAGKDEEMDVISKEIELLRTYCQELITIKEENERLKYENDELKDMQSRGQNRRCR